MTEPYDEPYTRRLVPRSTQTIPEMLSEEPTYLDYLSEVANEDVLGLEVAEKSYGDSWKKRGGCGAFMMLARKWDRLEKALQPRDVSGVAACSPQQGDAVPAWDIFKAVERDVRPEGIIDDIRDLRRYLNLVEAEMRARGVIHGKHRDNR